MAGILLNVVTEYRHLTHKEVMDLIVSSEVNHLNAEIFSMEDLEEKQAIIYDVIVHVKVKYQDRGVHLIFDLEMQRKFKPGYSLLNRMSLKHWIE